MDGQKIPLLSFYFYTQHAPSPSLHTTLFPSCVPSLPGCRLAAFVLFLLQAFLSGSRSDGVGVVVAAVVHT